MARFLAYTSPAAGHLFPLVPGLLALRDRGHDVRVLAPAEHLDAVRAAGVDAAELDPRVAAVEVRDYEAESDKDRLHKGVTDIMARGPFERADLERAIADYRPDVLLIDVNPYGAAVAAERSGLACAT